jgi:hypothetical protein
MSRPAQLTIGTGDAEVALEYVKTRRVLRIRPGWAEAGRDTSELPLHMFLDELGIDAADVAPSCQYLLFAGANGRSRGGTGDLVRVYRTEESAKAAFRALRLESGEEGWGELTALDAAGRLRRMCWYGSAGGVVVDDTPGEAGEGEPRRGPLGRLRGAARRRRETSEGDLVA